MGRDPVREHSCPPGYGQAGRRKLGPLEAEMIRRLAAIEGRVYTRPVKRTSMTFYFVYHSTAISVPDTWKCSWLWLIH